MAETATQKSILQFSSMSEIDRVYDLHEQMKYPVAKSTAKERIQKIKSIKGYIEKHEVEITEAIFKDFAKPHAESVITEIIPTIAHAKEITKHLKVWMEPKRLHIPLAYTGLSAKTIYESKGAALVIAPWNYPFFLAIYPVLYAIAAGCTVVLKPSELTPHTAKAIEEMLASCLPADEVKVLQGGIEETTHLLTKKWGHIFFTGSPAVGKIVMKAASKNLSSVSLELGGKSPCIIDDTADLETIANRLTWGKFLNAGQTCIAPDYVLVQDNVKDELVSLLKKEIGAMYGADPKNSSSFARVISEKHTERISELIGQSIKEGATLAHGGKFSVEDRFIEPTVLTEITPEMGVMKEEIFGPLLPILTYKRKEEAVQVIRGLEKPLSMYLCTKSDTVKKFYIENTSSGGLLINDFILGAAIPSVPFGGVNNSGLGKAFGFHGFIEFSNEKPVMRRNFGTIKFIYPPYSDFTNKILKWLKKLV